MKRVRLPARQRLAPYIFLMSGFSGLVYQVVWARWLATVFGVTAYAVSMVLAVFFAGLALGGWLGGKLADRLSRNGPPVPAMAGTCPGGHVRGGAGGLVLYGWAEISIGLLAFLIPFLVPPLDAVYRAAHASLGSNFAVWTMVRLAMMGALLLLPTTLMGATLPLILAGYRQMGRPLGAGLAWLYALNTLGAMTGALAAAFVLIGRLGLRGTTLVAVGVNLLVGLAALGLSRVSASAQNGTLEESKIHREGTKSTKKNYGILGGLRAFVAKFETPRLALLAGLFLSGVAALGYEVVWTRVLDLLLAQGTVYSFGLMLAAVLLGIGLGSLFAVRLAERTRNPLALLAALEAAVGALTVLSVWLVGNASLSHSLARQSTITLALGLMLPNLLLGAIVPLGIKVYAQSGPWGGVGEVYALNLLGGVAGSLLAGFVLLPHVGSQRALLLFALLNLGVAGTWFLVSPARRRWLAVALPVLAMWAGLINHPNYLLDGALARRFAGQTVLFNEEGLEGTVTVTQTGPIMAVYRNGIFESSNQAEMLNVHRGLAHLPLVLHPDPRRMLIIGLGGGSTPGAASLYGLETLRVIELSPSMLKAAVLFDSGNYDVLASGRAEVILGDGRQYLQLTSERYDVIESDVFKPRIAYSGYLYSTDFYELVRDHLAPGGVMAQWLDTSLPGDLYKIHLRSFITVFPNTTLWMDGQFAVGGGAESPVYTEPVAARFDDPLLRESLATAGIFGVDELRARLTMTPDEIRAYVREGPLLTDDRLYLEYFLSRSTADTAPPVFAESGGAP